MHNKSMEPEFALSVMAHVQVRLICLDKSMQCHIFCADISGFHECTGNK